MVAGPTAVGKSAFALRAALELGGEIIAAPITYLAGGRQQVTIAAGPAIFTFALKIDD